MLAIEPLSQSDPANFQLLLFRLTGTHSRVSLFAAPTFCRAKGNVMPFKVYPMTNEARSKRMRGGPTREFASKEQAIKFAGRQVGGYYAVYQRGRKIWP